MQVINILINNYTYESYVYPEQLTMYPKMKHKVDKYVRYVNIVNVVLFTKNTNCKEL